MISIPRLLLLPGAGADPRFWAPLGDLLPPQWGKHYFGWPGLGHQPARAGINSIDDLVSFVEEQLGEQPVDLLAQSMGGMIAMLVALRNPKKVRRIVLSVTSAGVDMEKFGAAEWRDTYFENYPNAARWVLDSYRDLSVDLPRLTQPTLLIWGDSDPISPVAVGLHLSNLLPSAQLVVLPGGDHDVVHDRAAEVAPLVQQHLS